MKKSVFGMFLAFILLLSACGGGEKPHSAEDPSETPLETEEEKPYSVKDTSKALLEAEGVFSEELIPLERAVFVPFLGVDDSKLTDGAAYASSGSTAEELAVLEFASEDDAEDAVAQLEEHLANQKESNEDYRPNEMPKLDKAVIRRRGNTLLFLVADDYTAAEEIVG